MSSHREAPEISKDPVADNTDVYAFVSPDSPKTVTIIANFVPLQDPPGGPNFFEFGDDVLYSIYIDNDGDGRPEIEYAFRFKTTVANAKTFLYNTGPITSLDSANWNRKQTYSVTRIDGSDVTLWGTGAAGRFKTTVLGTDLPCPPCNIGFRSTPNYSSALGSTGGANAVQRRQGVRRPAARGVLRRSGVDLRPRCAAPVPGGAPDPERQCGRGRRDQDAQRPLDRAAGPDHRSDGRWFAADRSDELEGGDRRLGSGQPPQGADGRRPERLHVGVGAVGPGLAPRQPAVQRGDRADGGEGPVELAVPQGRHGVRAVTSNHPELAGLLPVLYPGVFPNLAALSKPRADLVAILLTGIPSGLIAGFQNNTGSVQADQLRLNLAIPPTTSNPSPLGLLGNDLAGFPNGRRVFDDVVSIELRAIAGATYPLVDSSYTPDAAASQLNMGITVASNRYQKPIPVPRAAARRLRHARGVDDDIRAPDAGSTPGVRRVTTSGDDDGPSPRAVLGTQAPGVRRARHRRRCRSARDPRRSRVCTGPRSRSARPATMPGAVTRRCSSV